MKWSFTRTATSGGRFQLVISKLSPQGRTVDVTTVRGAPTQLENYSEADPFGDSSATFRFPAITPFDDLQAADLGTWLDYYSNVDLYWIPAIPADTAGYEHMEPFVINALTNQPDVITPTKLRNSSSAITGDNRVKVWEGFLASMEFTADEGSASLQIQCQGALFQLDRYLQKPFFPPMPWPLESLISETFSHTRKPHLRTQPLQIQWPAAWGLVIPRVSGPNVYTPVGKPGSKWSGYISRDTGSWGHSLTEFVQDNLTVMLTDERSGVTPGNQWTIQQIHQGLTSPGRAPVLLVRDRFRTPDFSLWLGTPGVSVSMSGDSTQSENIIYGEGTDLDGAGWRNAVISNDGSRTDYEPMAYSREIYPERNNPAFQQGAFVSESFTKYPPGFDQPAAISNARQALVRDQQPGWTGSITLSTDPSELLPRWLIRAGMTVLLKGFAGSGETGIPFHISAKTVNPMTGTVELTVDTRYRDLLTVEEAQQRTRDPLTPVKMLQVNKTSVMVEDLQAPWDYGAGSGFIPRASVAFHKNKPVTDAFPYTSWARNHPPLHYPTWYVKVNAGAPTRKQRWSAAVPILTSKRGSIIRTEVAAYDLYGRLLAVPFHVSIYKFNNATMPFDGQGPSPYINNAFETVTSSGVPVNPHLQPDPGMILGWGNRANGVYNRAGFSPGRESNGGNPTGLLVDDSQWNYDNSWQGFFLGPPIRKIKSTDISIYAFFYCEYSQPVYFLGRLFRLNPGANK